MNLQRYKFTFFSVLLAIVYGLYTYQQGNYREENSTLKKDVKAEYLKGGDFQLMAGEKIFKLSELKGQPVILYFGYTHCPDVCPVGLAVIRDALTLGHNPGQVKALFVTLDPERDDASTMTNYTQFFHPDIVGLTGTVDEIKKVAGNYGAYFRKAVRNTDDQNYNIDHTAYFYVIDKRGTLVRVLDHDTKPEDLSAILSKL